MKNDAYIEMADENNDKNVYLIVDEGKQYCKIGYSQRPNERLSGIQTGNPLKLHIYGTIKGDVRTEKSLHKRFAHLRLQGEWFKYDSEIIEYFNKELLDDDELRDYSGSVYYRKTVDVKFRDNPFTHYVYFAFPKKFDYSRCIKCSDKLISELFGGFHIVINPKIHKFDSANIFYEEFYRGFEKLSNRVILFENKYIRTNNESFHVIETRKRGDLFVAKRLLKDFYPIYSGFDVKFYRNSFIEYTIDYKRDNVNYMYKSYNMEPKERMLMHKYLSEQNLPKEGKVE